MPLISIITPAFNAVQTLSAAIDSVRAQGFQDWEMIIIDDASLDGTTALSTRYTIVDQRIRIIRRAENCGVSKARNHGLAAATGRYVAFMNANDLWLPEKLQNQLDFMQSTHAMISCTGYRRFRNRNMVGRVLKSPPRVTFDTLLQKNTIGASTVMIDRDYSGPFHFNEELSDHEDLALWLDFTKSGTDIYFLDQDLARQRRTMSSPARWPGSLWSLWRVFRHIAGIPVQQSLKAFWHHFLYKAGTSAF